MLFVEIQDFPDHNRLRLIECLYYNYFNTDQDVSVFAEEFYYVVGYIHQNQVPVKLKFLIDFQESACEVCKPYRIAYEAYLVDPSIALNMDVNETE